MGITFFHWGLHAWAIYVVLALGLAYSAFRLGHPLSIRSALRPLFGRWLDGPLGHVIDVLAVFATLFGLATSLGLGSAQIRAGLQHVSGVTLGTGAQVAIIAVVTLAATASVVTGLHAGIRRLSQLNLLLAVLLLLFVFSTGPSLYLLNSFADNLSFYLGTLVERTFLRAAPSEGDDWLASWTLFYWAWWIAWSPFVGTFIARISRGRTIREVVLGCLLLPSAVVFVWFTVFGNSALYAEIHERAGLGQVVSSDPSLAIYALLERLPASSLSVPLTVVLVAVFFVTSSDSGSFVVDMITSGGHPNPPVRQRVFWALAEGAVAAALLVVGGLEALQAASISIALPFSLVLLLIPWSMARALRRESLGKSASPREEAMATTGDSSIRR
jgi:choline/glycine/proline betaine transport protein